MSVTEGPFDPAIRELLAEVRALRKSVERMERAQPKPIRNSAPIVAPRRVCDPEARR